MGSLGTNGFTSGVAENGHDASAAAQKASGSTPAWRFDTLQVHAGLEKSPAYGQCTLPVYSSASFKFESSAVADKAFTVLDKYIYSRCRM
jgi:O-acetylhomoserine/O-acetylserine sulfhydrylase